MMESSDTKSNVTPAPHLYNIGKQINSKTGAGSYGCRDVKDTIGCEDRPLQNAR